jgi:hypothetical protein
MKKVRALGHVGLNSEHLFTITIKGLDLDGRTRIRSSGRSSNIGF